MRTLTRWIVERFTARDSAGCRGCGRCCDLYGGNLLSSKRDLDRWRAAGREDLVAMVGRLGWLWIDPASGTRLTTCPFLLRTEPDRALCRIHEEKPEMCRAYPTLWHERRCVRGVFFD